MKAYNGNKILFHLNKGNSDIPSKVTLIKDLEEKDVPDLISLNETTRNLTDPNVTKPFDGF